MRRKELKQKSLFDPAPAADQVEPKSGEDAKGEGIEVAVNDFAIDAGEPIHFAAIETKVGDDVVLIEVIPPRVETYHATIHLTNEKKLMDVVTVAKVTIISDGEVFEHYLVRKPVTARYAYQLTDNATRLE